MATITNKIKKNGKIIKQDLTLISNGQKILSYSTVSGDIFSIEKIGGKFKLQFSSLGKALLGLTSDIDVELADKSVSMLPRKTRGVTTIGQEMELTVKINGKESKLVANAESVKFTTGQASYEYQSAQGTSLGVNLSEEGIGLVMGDGKLFASTPKTYDRDFPLPIFKLLVAARQNNSASETTVGNFTLKTFNSYAKYPHYVMIDNTSNIPYVMHANSFHQFTGYVPLQDDNGRYYLALRGTGNVDLRFDLTSENGTFSQSALDMISFVSSNPNLQNLSSPAKATLSANGISMLFEKEDSSNIKEIKPAFSGQEYDLGMQPSQAGANIDISSLLNLINTLIVKIDELPKNATIINIQKSLTEQISLLQTLNNKVENNNQLVQSIYESTNQYLLIMQTFQASYDKNSDELKAKLDEISSNLKSQNTSLIEINQKLNKLDVIEDEMKKLLSQLTENGSEQKGQHKEIVDEIRQLRSIQRKILAELGSTSSSVRGLKRSISSFIKTTEEHFERTDLQIERLTQIIAEGFDKLNDQSLVNEQLNQNIIAITNQFQQELNRIEQNNTLNTQNIINTINNNNIQVINSNLDTKNQIYQLMLMQLQNATKELAREASSFELKDLLNEANMQYAQWANNTPMTPEAQQKITDIMKGAREVAEQIEKFNSQAEGNEALPEEIEQKLQSLQQMNKNFASPDIDTSLAYFTDKFVASLVAKGKPSLESLQDKRKQKEKDDGLLTDPISIVIAKMLKEIRDYLTANPLLSDEIIANFNVLQTTINQLQQQYNILYNKGASVEIINNLNKNIDQLSITITQLLQSGISPYVGKLLKEMLIELKKLIKLHEKDIKPEEKEEDEDEKDKDKEYDKKEEKQTDEKKKDEPQEISYKTQIENWTKATAPLGAFLFIAGCFVPVVGPLLLGVGLTAFGGSIILNHYADKFKFKQTFGKFEKIITQAEQEALEDADELAKFIENEKTLNLSQEKINDLSQNLDDLLQDESLPTHILTEMYDKYGIGFNANNNLDNSRSHDLCGLDGHKIRTSMYDMISAIQNAPENEKQARIDEFFKLHFTENLPVDAQEQLSNMFKSEDSLESLTKLTMAMKDLNDTEQPSLDLLSEQKVALGGMRDELIAKLFAHSKIETDNFVQRYGSTIYRRFALDDNLSQDKLNQILSKLSDEKKAEVISQLEEIGDRMVDEMDGVARIAAVVEGQYERAETIKAYIYAMNTLNIIPPVATIQQVTKNTQIYLGLKSHGAISESIRKTNESLDELRDLGSAKLSDLINIVSGEPALTSSLAEKLKLKYQLVEQEARACGIYDIIAQQYAEGLIDINLDTHSIDDFDKSIEIISNIVKANPDKPEYRKLREAIKPLASGKTQIDITKRLFDKFYKNLNLSPEEIKQFSGQVEQEWQELVAARTKRRAFALDYTDEYADLGDNEMKKALIAKAYIRYQQQTAGNSDIKKQYKGFEKLYNMTLNGTLAKHVMNQVEIDALGLTILDPVAQTEDSVELLTESTVNLQNLNEVINKLPERDREAVRKDIYDIINDIDSPDANVNDLVKMALIRRYGNLKINTSAPTAGEIISKITLNDVKSLVAHFPEADREELEKEINFEILKSGVNKEVIIRRVLEDRYQDKVFAVAMQHAFDMDFASTDMIVNEWLKECADREIEAIKLEIDKRARLELSCVANDLGENYSNMLFDELVSGTQLAERENYNLTESQKNKESHLQKVITSMETTEELFTEAWRKATKEGNFDALGELLKKPGKKATEAEKLAYNKLIKNLKEFGVNVEEIETRLNKFNKEIAQANGDGKKLLSAKQNAQAQLNLIEKTSGYSVLGKETIAEKKTEFATLQKINRAYTEHDKEYISRCASADKVINDAEKFTNKYSAILALKNPPHNYSPEQIRNVLYHFATGNFFHLAQVDGLKGIRFNENDFKIFKNLGIDYANLENITPADIEKQIKKRIKEEEDKLKEVQDKVKDQRKEPRSADLTKSKKPKQIRNRISLIKHIFGNIHTKDMIDAKEKETYVEIQHNEISAVPELEEENENDFSA